MVVIYVVIVFLFIFVRILAILLLINKGICILSIKLFNVGFFGDFEILINTWRILFLLMVVLIRSRVLVFSFSYIRRLFVSNFIFLYLRFIISMLWLIINNNFYWMIFGWDGLGVVSFLLIVFYINYERVTNGLFTLFQNRVGDLFFVLFILGLIDLIIWSNLVLVWGIIFLVIGSSVKRAQFPFNAWLLSAISAPTPISSLVHSSTLVVAGVFILLQYSYCLIDILEILKYIRLLTLIFRRFGLLNESDIKKLVAYSTIRHVSLILYLLSFKLFKVTYFHLNVHAIFKSLMFICFGFVILRSFHAQDKRLVSLINLNPIIKIIYYFSCLCLAGLPFLRAFFSKDLIIEKFIESRIELRFIFMLILFLGVRIYYRIKLLNLTNVKFVYTLLEKSFVGIVRVYLMTFIIIVMINVYLTLIFRVTLEFLSFKLFIYLFVIVFLILSLITNLNYKIFSYDQVFNFKEIWVLDYYIIDKYAYWNIFLFLQIVVSLSNVKYFLLMNWWVFILVVVFFYNESFKSVVLKKLRVYYNLFFMVFSIYHFR